MAPTYSDFPFPKELMSKVVQQNGGESWKLTVLLVIST